ncbi:hypothetical protein E2A64_05200 [Pseudohoeflea suaedae]|uniref:Uncharacterized protein n=1 Tax=Pseudohoeflea suaedae TaxID=877384 RepID=A0A4R5PNT7_9HYPH|nr:DUF6665 family protein [Pseudohoeflea suaedae]TDH38503.1 hypothetical protein E2A64_05200 [Pseudohoeflea suaedae]
MPVELSHDMIRKFEEISGIAPIEVQASEEQAYSLGKAGRDVEMAIIRLNETSPGSSERDECLWDASDAVWRYFIQREACGVRDHRQAIRFYGIPGEVLARLGGTRPRKSGAAR